MIPPKGPKNRKQSGKGRKQRAKNARRAARGGGLALALLCALATAAPQARAQAETRASLPPLPDSSPLIASETVQGPSAAVRLLVNPEPVDRNGQLHAALDFAVRPGWKTYWRSPGATGFGVETDWSGSQNLESAQTLWPTPKRFHLLGEEALGYADRLTLPLQLQPRKPRQPLQLNAELLYLVCEAVCIPHEASLALAVPGAGESTGRPENAADAEKEPDLIAAALAEVPVRGSHRVRLLAQTLHLNTPFPLITFHLTVFTLQTLTLLSTHPSL